MSDNTRYGDIGIDLTVEDEQIFEKVRAEMPKMCFSSDESPEAQFIL